MGTGSDLLMVSLEDDHATEVVLATEFTERDAALSSDGRWLAYQSDGSGRTEVYVRPFPDVDGGRIQISTNGGRIPAWSPNVSELFYVEDDRMMVASIQTTPDLERGVPETLFEGNFFFGAAGAQGRSYDVASDGRFLMIKPETAGTDGTQSPAITLVIDWFQELTERVPVS